MFKGYLLVLVTVLGIVAVTPVQAQVPSPEQLELFRTLAPEDQEALLEQLGIGGEGGMEMDSDAQGQREGQRPDKRDRDGRADGQQRNDMLMVDKTLKPSDTVLIELAFIKDKPPRLEQQGPNLPPITVPGEPAPVMTQSEHTEAEDLMRRVVSANPYQLDASGALLLPGFAPIVLAGLDEPQATRRLKVIDVFQKLDVKVSRLPVRRTGPAALKPFGYDLFKRTPSTFAPTTDVPVPSDYVVGPGDQLVVQLYGNQNRTLRLAVGRDGRINVPGVGPISVGNRTFSSASTEIEQRVAAQLMGVRASVGMGDTRSIRVFVMGEAGKPGSYTISGLATVTSALYAAGGFSPIGSLRDVQLKRQGAVVRRLDLYDLLLRGDTSNDARLMPGDVIFIPPRGPAVSVDGEVQRPAVYELRGETSVDDLVRLAGGLTADADPTRVAVVRLNESNARVVVDVPLGAAGRSAASPRNGDAVRVLRLRPTLDFGVTVEGHVYRDGPFAWRDGLRIADVLSSVDDLRPNADLHYVLISREMPPDRRRVVLSADLDAALRNPSSPANIELKPRDRIVVFDVASGRQQLLDPVLDEIRRQSGINAPTAVVRIDGKVRSIGDYPLEPGMRVSDLLRAGGGLEDSAYAMHAELTRYRIEDDSRKTTLVQVDLGAILQGDSAADLLLQPFDFLNVKEVPEWSEQEKITLTGEVRFPGIFPIQRGETLRSVLTRAGGLTSLAFPEGAVFTREDLKTREQEQMDRLADRMQSDLAAAALMGAQANQGQVGQALTVGQQLLNQLKEAEAVGRLVIDLRRAMAAEPGSSSDIVLRDGDLLIIPKLKQEVTVIGEVQNSTSHFYNERLDRDDYLSMSGGLTRKADRGAIYVVRADGSVISNESVGWFRRSAQVAIRPGDTIVAPLDTERMPALPLWQAVTQILYNLAVSAAAVASF